VSQNRLQIPAKKSILI